MEQLSWVKLKWEIFTNFSSESSPDQPFLDVAQFPVISFPKFRCWKFLTFQFVSVVSVGFWPLHLVNDSHIDCCWSEDNHFLFYLVIYSLYHTSYRKLVNFFFHFSAAFLAEVLSLSKVWHFTISEFLVLFKRSNCSKVNSSFSTSLSIRWYLADNSVNFFSNLSAFSFDLASFSSIILFSDSNLKFEFQCSLSHWRARFKLTNRFENRVNDTTWYYIQMLSNLFRWNKNRGIN